MDNQKVLDLIEDVKPIVEKAKDLMVEMMNYPNKLDKSFYLGVEDELTVIYDGIIEKHLTLKLSVDQAKANTLIALRKNYETTKCPPVNILDAEVKIQCSEIEMAGVLMEGYLKSVKNALQTSRSHVNAIVGKDEGNEE